MELYRQRRSFTIIELLVAISIIAILAGLMVGGLGGVNKQSNKAATKADLMKLEMALNQYYQDNGSYPAAVTIQVENEDGDKLDCLGLDSSVTSTLLGYESFTVDNSNAVTPIAIDAWDRPIIFEQSSNYGSTNSKAEPVSGLTGVYYNPKSFQLISAGEDGDPTTDNDNVYNFDKK